MKHRARIFLLPGPILLTATGDDGLADQLARDQAREAVNPVLAERSGVPLEPATNCVTNRVLNPQSDEDYLRDCIDRRIAGKPAPVTYGITVGGRT